TIIIGQNVSTGGDSPQAVALAGEILFFSNWGGIGGDPKNVRRRDLTMGGISTNVGTATNVLAGMLAVGGNKVFWSNFGGTTRVYRANLDGTGAEEFATGDPGETRSSEIAVDATDVYWADWDRGVIFKRAIAASGACSAD